MIPLRKEFEITTRYQDTYRKSSWKLNEWLQLLIIVEFLIENENFLSRKIFRSLMKKMSSNLYFSASMKFHRRRTRVAA